MTLDNCPEKMQKENADVTYILLAASGGCKLFTP